MSRMYIIQAAGAYASRPFNSAAEADDYRETLITAGLIERWDSRVEIFDNPEEELEYMREELADANMRAEELEVENSTLRKELDEWRMAANQ